MKKRYFGILILLSLMLLSGCESGIEEVKAKQDPDGFFEPEAGEWVEYIKPLREYMYLRTKAVLQDDIDLLWDRFPDLKEIMMLKRESMSKSMIYPVIKERS